MGQQWLFCVPPQKTTLAHLSWFTLLSAEHRDTDAAPCCFYEWGDWDQSLRRSCNPPYSEASRRVIHILLVTQSLIDCFSVFYPDVSNNPYYSFASTANSLVPNVLQSNRVTQTSSRREIMSSGAGSKMFGWIRTSHEAQVQRTGGKTCGTKHISIREDS